MLRLRHPVCLQLELEMFQVYLMLENLHTENARIAALHDLGVLDSEPESEFDAIVRAAASLCGVPISLMSLVDKDRLWVKACVGLDDVVEVPRSISFCTYTIEQREILEIPDTHEDPRFSDNPMVTGEPGIRFYAGAALCLSDGYRVGSLSVVDTKPGKLTPAIRKTLIHLARAVSHVLESRRYAQALIASESRFRTLCDASPLGIFATDTEGAFTYVNQRWLHIFGIDEIDSVGYGWQRALAPEIRTQISEEWQQLVKLRQEFDREFLLQHVDGNNLTVRVMSRPVITDENFLIGHVGMVEDISEKKALRDLHKRTSRLLQQTGEMARVGGWEYDLDTKQLLWTEQTRVIHGVSQDFQPQFDTVIDMFFKPKSQTVIRDAISRAFSQRADWDVEVQLCRPDGSSIWVRLVGRLEISNGRSKRLCGAIQDIDEQVRQRYALENAHERMTIATDSSQIGIWEFDIQSGKIQWTPQMFKLYGLAESEVQPTFAFWSGCLHANDRAHVVKQLTEAIAEKEQLDREFRIVRPDGSVRYLRSTARVKRDNDSQSLVMLGVNWDVTEQRLSTQAMVYRATHDELTAVLNRSEFEAKLQQLLEPSNERSGVHAIMFIDLDQFKIVNDACGHTAGDQLLKQVANLLKHTVPDCSTIARLGGDEFGLLVKGSCIEQVRGIAQSICNRMDDYRFSYNEQRFRIGASIGLVQVENRWETTASLMQAADSACYVAKDEGRNRVHVWCDTDVAMTIRRDDMQWAARLEQSLDNNHFVLTAQRLTNLKDTDSGLNAELLIRLKDDSEQLIQPSAFLPAAERFHLATRIDRWVLKETIELLENLSDLSIIEKLWINLSGQSVGDREFHRDALLMLENAGVDVCRCICIEITETAAVTNIADATNFIGRLRSLDIDTALDDFGAGASSFGYLKTLPVDILKIDGQFIRELGENPLDAAAVRCFTDVASVVGLKTVAEHVDSDSVLDTVREMGIDYAQGFTLHRPEPIHDLLQLYQRESFKKTQLRPQCVDAG